MKKISRISSVFAALAVFLSASAGWALEPPTKVELVRYLRDGSLFWRIQNARELGNDVVAPELIQGLTSKVERLQLEREGRAEAEIRAILPVFPSGIKPALRNKGTVKVFALLIDFSDYPASQSPASINGKLFGDGDGNWPYESLRNYYRRSSYGQLEIQGNTLGWYRPASTRASMAMTSSARENLIKEALNYYHNQGHNFSQYDNDGNGSIDYFLVLWTGPDNGWANFWWGYFTGFYQSFVLDGKSFYGTGYSWQWESRPYPGTFNPVVTMHETGHALGLPDYYDYDDTVGPKGGLGGLDMMDANRGDHNCFSKMLLDWITPQVFSLGTKSYALGASGNAQDALIVMPGYSLASPFAEFFMVQNRLRVENDAKLPGDGFLIWHLDASLAANGQFQFNNSYTAHKILRLMEADGLEQIEQGYSAGATDYFVAGKTFGPATTPNSRRYNGADTMISVYAIGPSGQTQSLTASINNLLTIAAGPGGTTNPAPGNYTYTSSTTVTVTAAPNVFYGFKGWTGDASGRTNPLTVTFDTPIVSVTATFVKIQAPLQATVEQVVNRSLSQAEYINVLRWQANPANENIAKYRIYLVGGTGLSLLAEVSSGTFTYWHRRVARAGTNTYAIVAVNDEGREGEAAAVTR